MLVSDKKRTELGTYDLRFSPNLNANLVGKQCDLVECQECNGIELVSNKLRKST